MHAIHLLNETVLCAEASEKGNKKNSMPMGSDIYSKLFM